MQHKEDFINIFLILCSFILAFLLPFELFLFSYAILGPLHYLTEIGWLHQRNYFSTGKYDFLFLIFFCFCISFGVVFHDIFVIRKLLPNTFDGLFVKNFMTLFNNWFPVFIFAAFFGSIGLVSLKSTINKIIIFILGVIVGYLFKETAFTKILIGVFVPTLIHVYVFTLLFMLFGAIKQKSIPGFISVVLLIICALSFYFFQYVPSGYAVSSYIKDSILKTGFSTVNINALSIFKSGPVTFFDLFESRKGFMIQRFIAFAYTYHYLNWFSKTEIIKWHQVPKKWLYISFLLWITSILVYAYDYRTGLIALFFLSLLHVFLEFPLNMKSIAGIFTESKKLFFNKTR